MSEVPSPESPVPRAGDTGNHVAGAGEMAGSLKIGSVLSDPAANAQSLESTAETSNPALESGATSNPAADREARWKAQDDFEHAWWDYHGRLNRPGSLGRANALQTAKTNAIGAVGYARVVELENQMLTELRAQGGGQHA